MSAFGQFRNSPHISRDDFNEFPHRLAIYYASHAARDSGELLAGYLHHEDPRYHRSYARSFWRRTDSALLSVLISPGEDGHLRPAFAPIAGSLSSAFAGSAMFRGNETLPNALTRAGFTYSRYFLRAMYLEFRPEMAAFTRHVLRRD